MTELTDDEVRWQNECRTFVDQIITPFAEVFERERRLPQDVVAALSRRGYMGALIPIEFGGVDIGPVAFGILNEELGRASASVRTLITVHSMVCIAVAKWGSSEQKLRWLPRLASGEAIGGFALTEADAGSDIAAIKTAATAVPGGFRISGHKQWVSFGLTANVFLVFAKAAGNDGAFLVERGTSGLAIRPMEDVIGTRASMLAELTLAECFIPENHLIGSIGFGLTAVASTSLDIGRYSIAWGCVGMAQACLDLVISYAMTRRQFGNLIKDYQLVQKMITEIIVGVQAARLLCLQAARARRIGDSSMVLASCIAKYFSSKNCTLAASHALQIHGASGFRETHPVSRYFRDASLMEIIEGSSQMHELLIADGFVKQFRSSEVGGTDEQHL